MGILGVFERHGITASSYGVLVLQGFSALLWSGGADPRPLFTRQAANDE